MEYAFHVYNKLAADGVAMSLDHLLETAFLRKKTKKRGDVSRSTENLPLSDGIPSTAETPLPPPIVVCIGSDLAIGDSLGPIVGSMLRYKTQSLNTFLYGTLSAPITAKEIKTLRSFLRETHRKNQIIAIDAAVGDKGDIGLIKLRDAPLLPGAGANKNLGAIGDVSVMAVVAEKSLTNYGLLNTTRLNLVYSMAEIISDALSTLLWERCALKNNRAKIKNFL